MSQYDPNVDSNEPFLKVNNTVSNSGCSSSNAISNNGNNNIYNGVTASAKPTNKDFECHALQATIAKLRVWLLAITVVSIIGFVILIIVVTCLYTTLNYNLNHHTHKPKVGEQMAAILEREELCVPCDEFRLGPSPEEESMLKRFNLKDTPTGVSCCVDQPMELLELLKLVSIYFQPCSNNVYFLSLTEEERIYIFKHV